MAEAVFQAQVKQRNPEIQGKIVKIDSCGTGAYHVGDDPDERTVQTCKKVSRENEASLDLLVDFERFETVADQQDGSSGDIAAQGPDKLGRQSVEQRRLSRIHPYPRYGPDEVSRPSTTTNPSL